MAKVSINDPDLDPAGIAAWADKFEAAGVTSPWCEEAKTLHNGAVSYGDLCAIGGEIHRRDVERKVATFETTPAIRAYLLNAVAKGIRGLRAPEAWDATHFARRANTTTSQWGKPRPAWQPKGECPLKLKLKSGVNFGYSQEAYADMSTSLIPVEGDVSKLSAEELSTCKANITEFFRYADTHTGFAGSGCNWTAHLETNEHGAFVVVTCRASISD